MITMNSLTWYLCYCLLFLFSLKSPYQNSRTPGTLVHGNQPGGVTIGRVSAGIDFSRPFRPKWSGTAGLMFQVSYSLIIFHFQHESLMLLASFKLLNLFYPFVLVNCILYSWRWIWTLSPIYATLVACSSVQNMFLSFAYLLLWW